MLSSRYQFVLSNEYRFASFLLFFIFSTVIPPLVGYLAGDSATRNNKKITHHYNAVLFGILGIFIASALQSIYIYTTYFTVSLSWLNDMGYLFQYFPYIFTAIILIVLGVFYAKNTRHQVAILDYKPYRVILIGCVVATILSMGAAPLYADGDWTTAFTMLIAPTLFALVTILIGYWMLGKNYGTNAQRVAQSIVAVGISLVVVTFAWQLVMYITKDYVFEFPVTVITGLLVWLGYLYLLRRASR